MMEKSYQRSDTIQGFHPIMLLPLLFESAKTIWWATQVNKKIKRKFVINTISCILIIDPLILPLTPKTFLSSILSISSLITFHSTTLSAVWAIRTPRMEFTGMRTALLNSSFSGRLKSFLFFDLLVTCRGNPLEFLDDSNIRTLLPLGSDPLSNNFAQS